MRGFLGVFALGVGIFREFFCIDPRVENRQETVVF